jgi:hypothetical protein
LNFGFGRISIIFWIWGIILAVKAVKLFVLDYDWERKTIEKYIKNKKMEINNENNIKYLNAKKSKTNKRFYIHALVFVLVNIL